MSGAYDKLAASAAKTLKSKGMAMTMKNTAEGTYDPTTGTAAAGAVTSAAVYGIEVERHWGSVASSLVAEGDTKLLVSAGAGADPKDFDTILINGRTHTIVDTNPVSPGGVAVVHYVWARPQG